MHIATEFLDLWHQLKVPNDVDLLRALESGKFVNASITSSTTMDRVVEGLQATAAEAPIPKAPSNTRKKGKRSAPRQRQVRITNIHLKGEIDLSRDYNTSAK